MGMVVNDGLGISRNDLLTSFMVLQGQQGIIAGHVVPTVVVVIVMFLCRILDDLRMEGDDVLSCLRFDPKGKHVRRRLLRT